MDILGIWDGHDSGAALIREGKIIAAVNEERFTRRKTEIKFPVNSIKFCLKKAQITSKDIDNIACTTTDLSHLIGRAFPDSKENYYLMRRRKSSRPKFEVFVRKLKYLMGNFSSIPSLEFYHKKLIFKNLKKLDFSNDVKIHFVDHHMAHAACAYFCSGENKSLVVTMDGVGDGKSVTVNIGEGSELKCVSETPAKDSMGLFFEQVTTVVGMRELEDEGKVMALADYSLPTSFDVNPFKDWWNVSNTIIKSKNSPMKRFEYLVDYSWKTPREQIAFYAQQVLEEKMSELFENAKLETGLKNVSWAGGIASNIKLNMRIKDLLKPKSWFIFPHMGDGGLAVGAALYVHNQLTGSKPYKLENVYLGPSYSEKEIKDSLAVVGNDHEIIESGDVTEEASELLNKNNVVFWFQGESEYGPRALGHRSIIANTQMKDLRNKLNLLIKKRNWFQPFCPSMLESDAARIIENYDSGNDFMTMGYNLKEEYMERFKEISSIRGSIRPQIVNSDDLYKKLISKFKEKSSDGVVLNTSFNLHGFPLSNTPIDAIDTFLKCNGDALVLGNYIVRRKNS